MHKLASVAFLLTLLAACESTPSGATAFSSAQGPPEAFAADDDLAVWCAGLDMLLVDPKDRRLAEALALVEARLQEVPGEVGAEGAVPPEAIALAARAVVAGPTALQFGRKRNADPGSLPVYTRLSLREPDAASAQTLAERFSAFVEGLGGPLGVKQGVQGSSYEISVGEPDSRPLGGLSARSGLPDGIEPALAFKIDFGACVEAIGDVAKMAGEQNLDDLDSLGLEGFVLSGALGIGRDRSYWASVFPDYVEYLEGTTGAPSATLSREMLERIPEDAVFCSIGVLDFAGTLDFYLEMLEADYSEAFGGEDPLDAIAELTGIHLQRDLFEHFGERFGVYMSNATGGGGVSSLVALVELDEAEGVLATLERLAEQGNALGQSLLSGYVALSSWKHGEQELTTLSFPGLPVPFELTYAVADGVLYAAMTPAGAVAAIEQARPGGRSLASRRDVRGMLPRSLDDFVALSFMDTLTLLADGYGWTGMVTSAIANGVRSAHVSRDAGMVLPTFGELSDGARPALFVSRLVDGDLVSSGQMDRSMLVNLTGGLGLVDRLAPVTVGLPMVLIGTAAWLTTAQEASPFVYEIF